MNKLLTPFVLLVTLFLSACTADNLPVAQSLENTVWEGQTTYGDTFSPPVVIESTQTVQFADDGSFVMTFDLNGKDLTGNGIGTVHLELLGTYTWQEPNISFHFIKGRGTENGGPLQEESLNYPDRTVTVSNDAFDITFVRGEFTPATFRFEKVKQ